MESLTLTTPIAAYQIRTLTLDWDAAIISVSLRSTLNPGVLVSASYSGTTATNLMIALNKADLTVKSLHRRIIERLVADGVIIGTIVGTPD